MLLLGRSAFLVLAQVLTISGEKLINLTDYVRGGVLVHDVVDILQCIIDDCITSKQKKRDLTCWMLKNASNFLKNQFKSHITMEDGCDTHGIDHRLLPPVASRMQMHYSSCLEKVQLDGLLLQHGITVKGSSIIVA